MYRDVFVIRHKTVLPADTFNVGLPPKKKKICEGTPPDVFSKN
jgi:hypothetical protein